MLQLDAIADPVRLRILRHLTEHGRASAGELARAAEVHENTIRPHLQALEQAGVLITERRVSEGPGRPGIDYRLADEAALSTTDYRQVAALLTAALARLRPDQELLRRTGEDWGRYLLGRPGTHDIRERLPDVFERLGFHAEVRDSEVHLTGCPCPVVSPDNPHLLCELAAGVLAGALAASGSRLELGHCKHDPARRDCTLALERRSATRRS